MHIPNKNKDLNLSVFNMITRINESKTIINHITKCKSIHWWDNEKCWCECKKLYICEKGMFGIVLFVVLKMEKYLASIMDKIICNEFVDVKETNFNENNKTCKIQSFYILLTFLLITITLLITVSIYCYLVKYQVKQKHLLPF